MKKEELAKKISKGIKDFELKVTVEKPESEVKIDKIRRIIWTCEHKISHVMFDPKKKIYKHKCDYCCKKVKVTKKWMKKAET